jgi:trehalose-phosphatase
MTVPESFWRTLQTAPTALLALAYDGTLAPLRRERDQAVPYPGMRDLLARIREDGRTRLVVITGRAPEQAADLLGLDPVPEIWGSHGWEQMRPDGVLERRALPEAATRALAAAEAAVRDAGWADADLERKHASLALHWRGSDDPGGAEHRARELLAPPASQPGLDLVDLAAGLELRAVAWHKGRALAAALAGADAHAAAYLGDGHADEDAFAELAARGGLPLLVAAEDRQTAAVGRLAPPEDLRAFLTRWLDVRRRSS